MARNQSGSEDSIPEVLQVEQLDGRHERTARTRAAIVDAVIQLQESGVARATAAQIAEQAGISKRSIFVHFPSQEELMLAVMDELAGRLGALKRETPTGSFEKRVRDFVRTRVARLDKLVAYRRSAAAVSNISARVVERRRLTRQRMLDEIMVVFAPELRAAGTRRAAQLAMLIAINCESEAWETLRGVFQVNESEATKLLELAIIKLLAPNPGKAKAVQAESVQSD